MSLNIEINEIMTIGNDKLYVRNLDDIVDSLITQNIIDYRTARRILDRIEYYSNEDLSEEISNLEDENYELRMKVDRLEKENSRLFKN